jgi:hypothetical protein
LDVLVTEFGNDGLSLIFCDEIRLLGLAQGRSPFVRHLTGRLAYKRGERRFRELLSFYFLMKRAFAHGLLL